MKKNQKFTAEISGCTSQGLGVARIEGRAVFVKGAIPGESCEILIEKVNNTAAYGKLLRVIQASTHRIAPCCPNFGICGGCDFLHMDYSMEIAIKKQRVEDAMRRIGGFEIEDISILPAENPYGYRNKVQFPVSVANGRFEAGFYRARSHTLIPVENCCIQFPQAAGIARTIIAWMRKYNIRPYDEATGEGYIRHLYFRQAKNTGQIMVCLVVNSDELPKTRQLIDTLNTLHPQISTVLLNINKEQGNVILGNTFEVLCGSGKIVDKLCGLEFEISAASFYQVNHDQTEKLYQIAVKNAMLSGTETLLDLYCGIGTISLVMSRYAARVIGIEIIPDAVRNASNNAKRNGISNTEFLCEDAGAAAKRFAEQGIHPDVIMLDPPRKGIMASTVDAICRMAPSRIVYISCNPATLSRDLHNLCQKGYKLSSCQAADLFPRCKHVETVVLMSRVEGK